MAELKVWAGEVGKELEQLRGRLLRVRRQELVALRAQIAAVCQEIEQRQAAWAERASGDHRSGPSEA